VLSFLLAAFGGCLVDVKCHILRRSLHESRSLLWSLGLGWNCSLHEEGAFSEIISRTVKLGLTTREHSGYNPMR